VGRILRGTSGARVIPGEIVEASLDAAALRARAAEESAALLEAARLEAESLVRARAREAEAEALALVVRATREADAMLHVAEADLVQLALAITARVVAARSAEDETLVRAEARRAVAELSRARTLTLFCHPEDRGSLASLAAEDARIVVDVDPALARGDVVLQSDIGRVDARLSARLENVARALGRPACSEHDRARTPSRSCSSS
jgi:type III secretion protein L